LFYIFILQEQNYGVGTSGVSVGVGTNSVGTVVGVPVGTIMTVGETLIAGLVGDPIGDNVAVIAGAFVGIVGRLYSICNSGAPAWSTSYASATRLPVPVMIITSELPAAQLC
jgi:riboflavin transporter FmnP